MQTALDSPPNALNAYEKNFVAQIRAHGWFNTSVFDDHGENPGFSYTTGFWLTLGFPEIIVFSLPRQTSHDLLWDVFRAVREDRNKFPTGKCVPEVFANSGAYFFPMAKQHYQEYLPSSRWFYAGDNFPCLQLVWADTKEVFPWQHGFEERFRKDQPDLSPEGWIKSLAQ